MRLYLPWPGVAEFKQAPQGHGQSLVAEFGGQRVHGHKHLATQAGGQMRATHAHLGQRPERIGEALCA